MKYVYNLTFKMAISAMISLALCDYLGVQHGTVAAVISILSIQSTRKKALQIGINRLIACTIGICLSFIVYKYIGNSFIIFGFFILFFIPITNKLKVEEGMIAAVVLANHILVADIIDIQLLLNEFTIMFIGIAVAFIANLFMPSFYKQYEEDKNFIEDSFKHIILNMSEALLLNKESENTLLCDLDKRIILSEKIAYDIINNKLLSSNTYYLDYITMRKNQFNVIKKMQRHFERFYMSVEQTKLIAEYTAKIANDITENNDCIQLLRELDDLKMRFKGMDLPKTREEFENRAHLIQFLNDLEDFLEIKREFIFKK